MSLVTATAPPETPSQPPPPPADPCVMVIFGASGDLTKRKLIPALMNLESGGLLSERFAVIANARADATDESFRQKLMEDVREFVPSDVIDRVRAWIGQRVFYVRGAFGAEDMYQRLNETIARVN